MKKLISKIFSQIQKDPCDFEPYADMFSICREVEKEDFKLAHETNIELRGLITKALPRVAEVDKFFDLYRGFLGVILLSTVPSYADESQITPSSSN